MPDTRGTIYLKPSEQKYAKALEEKTGARTEIVSGSDIRRAIPSGSVSSSTQASQSDQSIRAAEEARKQKLLNDIRRTQEREIKAARVSLERDLRFIKDRNEAKLRREQFNMEVGEAIDRATQKKVDANLIISGGSAFVDAPRITSESIKESQKEVILEARDTGRKINGTPVTELIAIENGKERLATAKEQKFYRERTLTTEVPEKQTGLEGVYSSISQKAEQRRQREKGFGIKEGAIGFGQGVALSAVGTTLFAKQLVSDPIGTAKGVVSGVRNLPTSARQAGRILKSDPLFATGFVLAEVGTAYALGSILSKLEFKVPKGKAGKVGRAGRTKQVTKQVTKKGKKVKKKVDMKKVIEELQSRQEGKVIREKTFQEKLSDANRILREIQKTSDPKIKLQRLQALGRLLKQAHGEEIAKRLVKELAEENTLSPIESLFIEGRPPMSSIKLPSRQIPGQIQSQLAKQAPKTLIGQKGNLFFQQQTKQIQLSKQKQKLLTAQVLKQPQALRQKLLSLSALAQPSLLAQPQLSRTLFRFGRGGTLRRPRRRPRLTPKPKITPKIPSDVSRTKLVRKLIELQKKKQGLDIYTGMKLGKRRKIASNLPPFKALKFARDFVDQNIEASFRLQKSGKKTRKKDISPFNLGRKFRPSKRNVLFSVEKRKFRLDSPTERKQIKRRKRK